MFSRLLLVSITILIVNATAFGETIKYDLWLAGFETTDYPLSPGPIPCNAYLVQYGPDFTLNGWMTWAAGLGGTRIKADCTRAFTGLQCMSLSRSSTGGAATVYGRPRWPNNVTHDGTTIVFEEDIYIPSGAGIDPNLGMQWVAVGNGINIAAKWIVQANSTWLYFNGYDYTSTGVAFVPNKWNHVRTNLEPNGIWNMWVKPQDQPEIQVCANIPSPLMPDMDWSTFFSTHGSNGKPGTVYVDNVKVSWIVHNAQGYPVIPFAASGLVIDGTINPGEWTTKVANKPLQGDGNFSSPWGANKYNTDLDDSTTADIWAAYDPNFIYIAGKLNNAHHELADANENAQIEALFTYKGATAADYRQYIFGARADLPDGNSGYCFGYQNTTNPATPLDVNYTNFRNAGGKIYYSVGTDNVLSVEMKVPFVVMPQFAGIQCGGKMNVQFNVRGTTTGTTQGAYYGWYTTNTSMLLYPGQDMGMAVDPNKPLVGVTFQGGPAFGDITSDCYVNFLDVKLLSEYWLETESQALSADANNDRKVNMNDLAIIGRNWMACFKFSCI